LEWGIFSEQFSGVRRPNFTELEEDIRAIIDAHRVGFGYFAAFSHAGGSKSSDVGNEDKWAHFAHVDPLREN